MATETIYLAQNNTRPVLVCAVKDNFTENPIDLTDCSVVLKFRQLGDTSVRSVLQGSVTDPANGRVSFFWADDANALAGEPGPYEGEIVITFPDSTTQAVYDILNFYIREAF